MSPNNYALYSMQFYCINGVGVTPFKKKKKTKFEMLDTYNTINCYSFPYVAEEERLSDSG